MAASTVDVSAIVQRLATHSSRPRYTFMVLNLISEAAGPSGSVGPVVNGQHGPLLIRDWLSDALAPLAEQGQRRAGLTARVAAESTADATEDLAAEIRERVRRSSKTNISRAVSDLVRAGLLRRHYAGWCKDHHNRGAQRQAVYTVDAEALAALRRRSMLV
jgi:hypothetical protein